MRNEIDFDNFVSAYDSLISKMQKCDGYSYKDNIKASGKCPDLVRPDLLELKLDIDSYMRGFVRRIERHLSS